MADRNRSGFTLVELLVVVVIIAMLVGLLLPAVQAARESARQTQCTNNQHELALATLQYETAKGYLPGYLNSFGTAGNLSWAVVLFPHLGREDLWTEWRRPSGTYSYNDKRLNFMPDLPQLKCPSGSRSGRGVLSYVANCGIAAGTATQDAAGNPIPEGPAHGVFQNLAGSAATHVSSDRIPDGSQTTLLFSENVQATTWAPAPIDNNSANPWTGLVDPANGPDWREAHVGMVWSISPGTCGRINGCRDAEVQLLDAAGLPLNPPVLKPPYDTNSLIEVARPSSYHVAGVVVTYCDGHQDFVQDDIDPSVWQRQMASDDDKAGLLP